MAAIENIDRKPLPVSFNVVLSLDEYEWLGAQAEIDADTLGLSRPSRAAVIRKLIRAAMVATHMIGVSNAS